MLRAILFFFAIVAVVVGFALYRRHVKWRHRVMQDEINRLRASALAQTSVVASVVAFCAGLVEKVRESADDPDEIRSLADEIEANTSKLAAAIATNTPASDEVHADNGGTGDDSTVVDADAVELAEPAAIEDTGGTGGGESGGGTGGEAGATE